MGKPAVLTNQPRARRLTTAGRTIKVLRPVKGPSCDCDKGLMGWGKKCPHNPYVAYVPRKYPVPVYEDVLEDGKPTGVKRVIRTEEHVSYESRPNWKEVTLNPRLGGSTRLDKALAFGCIFPRDLRSPEYPDGLDDVCQFRGCFQQRQPDGKPLLDTKYGKYCREIEAKFAIIDQTGYAANGKRLEVGFNSHSQEKQRKQLEDLVVA